MYLYDIYNTVTTQLSYDDTNIRLTLKRKVQLVSFYFAIFAIPIFTNVLIYFQVEAQWTNRPKDVSVDVNTSLTWNCKAEGVPPIKYIWLHNGVKMKESADSGNYITNKGKLIFPRLQVNQKGMYQCLASNYVKQLITAAELDVKGICTEIFYSFYQMVTSVSIFVVIQNIRNTSLDFLLQWVNKRFLTMKFCLGFLL